MPPIKPCENCGATNFSHATPTQRKGGLTPADVSPGGRAAFFIGKGTAVDIYICQDCGCVRLFAVPME